MKSTARKGSFISRAPLPGHWGFAALAFIVLLAIGLRLAYYQKGYFNPDEQITVAVVGHMRNSGQLDANWAKAELLPPDLRYNQFNFSSYLYANYGFYRLVKITPGTLTWRSAENGLWVYRFFSVLLGVMVVLQTLALARRAGGVSVAALAGGWASVSVLLVQDAHYARPEAFTTALTLLTVALCWPAARLRWGAVAAAAFVLGVLVACKISLLMLGWLPLIPIAFAQVKLRTRALAAFVVLLAFLAGFALGAPGAWLEPRAFMHGVQALFSQYGGGHPPHGHSDGGPVGDMLLGYSGATLGWALLALGVVGIAVLAKARRWPELSLFGGPVILFFGYFATRAVFFERNLSHVLPLLLILAAVGLATLISPLVRNSRARATVLIALGVLLAVPSLRFTWPLLQNEFSGRGATAHDHFEHQLKRTHAHADWWEALLLEGSPLERLAVHFKTSTQPVLMRVTDYDDDWTRANLARFRSHFRAQEIATYPSAFPSVPVCTLLTYHSATDRYFLISGPALPSARP